MHMYVPVLCIYVEACTYEFEYVHTHVNTCVLFLCVYVLMSLCWCF